MNNIAANVYNVILHPKETFEELKANPDISSAIIIMSFVTFFIYTLNYDFYPEGFSIFAYLFSSLFVVINGLIWWLLLGVFFEMAAKIFDKSGHLQTYLCISAYAVLPLIFLAPLNLLKYSGGLGYFFSVIFELLLYFWVIYLFAKTLQIAYDLTFSRVIMLIFLPFAGSVVALHWAMGIISKIVYMFKI